MRESNNIPTDLVAQRLRKEHKLIDRREELAEEFKDSSLATKRQRIAATTPSMIGQWQEVDDNMNEQQSSGIGVDQTDYQYFKEEKETGQHASSKEKILKQNLAMCQLLGLPQSYAHDENDNDST